MELHGKRRNVCALHTDVLCTTENTVQSVNAKDEGNGMTTTVVVTKNRASWYPEKHH